MSSRYHSFLFSSLLQDYFTNQQYHTLVDGDRLIYETHHENSIFFEVRQVSLGRVLQYVFVQENAAVAVSSDSLPAVYAYKT